MQFPVFSSRFVFLVLLLNSFGDSLTGQSYITDTSNVWNVRYIEVFNPTFYLPAYQFRENVTVNGNTYRRLYRQGFGSVDFEPTQDLLRTDSSGRYYWYNGVEEYLHYDFNLIVGDTFDLAEAAQFPDIFEPAKFLATTVDTISYADNVPRKRIGLAMLDSPDQIFVYWVEGIGSFREPIYNPDSYAFNYEAYSKLCSFMSNGVMVYENSNMGDCEPSSVHSLGSLKLRLSPNPTDGIIQIATELIPTRTVVYDYTGRIVMEVPGVTEIDMSSLPAGIYMLRVWSAGQQFAQQWIAKH